jgi:phosphoenolpyruvate-protein phosphotransferase (PTS system enzyme I)
MGLRSFSVAPGAIPEIKKICRSVTIEQCQQLAERAMAMENARDIKSFVKKELRKAVPELYE